MPPRTSSNGRPRTPRIQQLESATAVLRQRKDEAEAAVQRVELAAAVEKEAEASAYLKLTVAPKIDDVIDQLSRVSTELETALDAARIAGVGLPPQSFLMEAKLQLGLFVALAIDPVTWTGKVPDRMRRYARWSDCIPGPETAGTRRRP